MNFMKRELEFILAISVVTNFVASCNDTTAQKSETASYTASKQVAQTPERTAKEVRGASPYIEIKNEPAPKLIIDPPIPEGLAQGVFWAQYRVENMHIVPVFGPNSLNVSPRIGHLHVIVDDLPWWWADASDNNTVDIAGFPPGPHKVQISLVNSNHEMIPGQSYTLSFTIPEGAKSSHNHHMKKGN